VDIEAAVADGSLDIGVFGPRAMVDATGAKEMVAGIVDVLMTARAE
jgi:hypothetical protein